MARPLRSAKVDILSRYVNFFHSLRKSTTKEVQALSRLLARDIRSVTARNLQYIVELSGLNPWTDPPRRIQAALVAQETVLVPLQDKWRVPYLCSLLQQRGEAHSLALEEEERILTELISSLVLN